MENLTTLERLSSQIDALLSTVQTTRDENTRLREQVSASQADCREKDEQIRSLQDQMGDKDTQLEDLIGRIEEVLGRLHGSTEEYPQDQPQSYAEAGA